MSLIRAAALLLGTTVLAGCYYPYGYGYAPYYGGYYPAYGYAYAPAYYPPVAASVVIGGGFYGRGFYR